MANFGRVNPLGWGLYELLTSGQMNALDINMTKTINAAEGSTHVPAADIILTGPHGLVSDQLTANSQLTANGPATINGVLTVNSSGAPIEYDERVVARRQTLGGAIFSPSNWSYFGPFIQQLAIDTPHLVQREITNLPHGSKLSSVSVSWDGANGHVSDPVNNAGMIMPKLEVFAIVASGGASSLGVQVDTVTSRAAYEVTHTITADCADHVIDLDTYVYYIQFEGEANPEAVAGGFLKAIKPSCKVTKQSEY